MNKLNYFLSILTIFVFFSFSSNYLIAGIVTLACAILLYFNPKLLNSPYLKNEKNGFIVTMTLLFVALGFWYLFKR